jgi:hypothetical protein
MPLALLLSGALMGCDEISSCVISPVVRCRACQLHKGPTCDTDMIRIFNGGLWHGGDANNTGSDVLKLFLGLVPGNHPTARDFPIFEDHAGKSLAEEKQRVVLVADDR